ncbi:MAG TPA: DUF87 domain-containing protein [Nocardioidaceae bacterium]|nr:DUF87 domain-containing protein [Nocardioidaceae bacterium]
MCAFAAGESSLNSWWFFIGLGIYVSAVFVEHHFTTPQDAVVNSVASLGAYLSAERAEVQTSWSIYLVFAISTLVASILATLPFEGRVKAFVLNWATTFGKIKVLGGLALLIEFSRRVAVHDEHTLVFGLGALALLVSVAGRWHRVLGTRKRPSAPSALSDAIGPSQLLLGQVATGTKRGQVVTLTHSAGSGEAVIAVTLPGDSGLKAVAIPLDHRLSDLAATLDTPLRVTPSDTAAPFVGVVGPGSTSRNLLFHPTTDLAVGDTLEVDIAGRAVLFQVVDVRLETLNWDTSRQVLPIATAQQLGVPDGGYLRLSQVLPEPHAQIRRYAATSADVLPDGFTRIGHIGTTDLPVGIAVDPVVRGHVAILGMTGMGKTTVVNRVCQALGASQPVIAIDVTGEYRSKLGWAPFTSSVSNGCSAHEPTKEFTEDAAEFIAKALATARAEYTSGSRQDRVLVLEEAHAMLPEQQISDWDQKKRVGESTRDIMQSRKYGLSYVFVSQRTAVITKSALSQCESYIVLRTIDDTSLGYLEAIAGPVVRQVVPSLARYEALCFGPAFNSENPVVVGLDAPLPAPVAAPGAPTTAPTASQGLPPPPAAEEPSF